MNHAREKRAVNLVKSMCYLVLFHNNDIND